MTRNADAGSDLKYVFGQPDLVLGARRTLDEVVASGIPERAVQLAKEIAAAQPDVVSLQEVTTWSAGPFGQLTVLYDQLELLLKALSSRNLNYEVVVANDLMDAQAPAAADFSLFVRIQDRDVILVRTNRPNLTASNPQKGRFSATLVVPTPLGPIPVPRGWCSVDLTLNGVTVRVFDTHLEGLFPPPFDTTGLQLAQASELVGIMSSWNGPAVVGGDFNSNANRGIDHSGVTDLMIAAGFTDTWTANSAAGDGNTWPLHDEDPSSAVSQPYERIDLIYSRNLRILTVKLVGEKPSDRDAAGRWPSDHAGVEATLQAGRQ